MALTVDQYGSGYPGPMCFLPITISYGGKTAQAVIMDEVRIQIYNENCSYPNTVSVWDALMVDLTSLAVFSTTLPPSLRV